MKRVLFWLMVVLALALGAYGCSSCSDSGDDDDSSDDDVDDDVDDDTADDDTIDDDTIDDDTSDDDSADDDSADDDEQPPYDTSLCAPFMQTFYDTCHFELELNGVTVTQEEATDSCVGVDYLVWPCLIDCYLDYGEACIDLYDCATECTQE